MQVVMVYKPESDHARRVITFLGDFVRQTGRTISELDPETPEGASFCRTYDVVEYPKYVAW